MIQNTTILNFPSGFHDKAIARAQKKIDALRPGSVIRKADKRYIVAYCTNKIVFLQAKNGPRFFNKASLLDGILNDRITVRL